MVSPNLKTQSRLKREDCYRTKHDSIFSNWQLLVGPSDWENYTSRKEGSERYRIHNLPTNSCPGIYELGVATANTHKGREIRKVDLHQIIVVYVGQADNVRARLQHYGRAGSHLDHGNTVSFLDQRETLQRGPGLFTEIFARGFSIVFRWAPMKSKREAEHAESLLLRVFDYAWNKVANGNCRRDDVLLKLEAISPSANPFVGVFRKLHFFKIHTLNRKRVGIKIEENEHVAVATEVSISTKKYENYEGDYHNSNVCGVTMTDGSICKNKPMSGRKRCLEHKGMRSKTRKSISTSGERGLSPKTGGNLLEQERKECDATTICGVMLEDGSVCTQVPSSGRKRCKMHKGRRLTKTHA